MGGRRVRMFHISDLHMRSVGGPQEERARLEAAARWRILGDQWTANLAELRRDGAPIDLIVFTGDLGDWGHPTDYPRALAFLRETCTRLNVSLDRLFVIPGNHDIDRTTRLAEWRWVRKNIGDDPRAFSAWMAGRAPRKLRRNHHCDLILERQRAFWAAVVTELGRPDLEPSRSPHKRLGYRQTVMLPGLSQPLYVIGLDTAWLAGDEHDSGKLRLTEHQVSLLTTTEDGAPLPGFRIALMHHRFADLADATDARRWMADRIDLLLHGHQHEPTADVLQGPDHQILVLATGCLYEGDQGHSYPNTCQVIDLILDEHARPQGAEVRFRGWSSRGLFWGDDALLYQRTRGERLRLGRGERGWYFDEGFGELDDFTSGEVMARHYAPDLARFAFEASVSEHKENATAILTESSASKASNRLSLKFITGRYEGAEVGLPVSGVVRIGRTSGLELELADALISRLHARILISNEIVEIRDEDSANGTFVNGEPIDHATRLNVNDRILVGTSLMRLVTTRGPGLSLQEASKRFEANSSTEGLPIRKKDFRIWGLLEEIPIQDLLRLLLISQKSGFLAIKTGLKLGQFNLVQGEIVSATVNYNPTLSKREAFLEIFVWRIGTFEFSTSTRMSSIADVNEIEGSTVQLLSEGLRMLRGR